MTARDPNHPVWGVYDRLRTARLNVKYYGRCLERVRHWHAATEVVLFASAPSSAVAGLWFWNTEAGAFAWKLFGVIAAIVALAKPAFALPSKIKKYEGLATGYRLLDYDLGELKTAIEQKRKYETPDQAELKKAIKKERELVSQDPATNPNRKLLQKCEREVLSELPSEAFFVPEE